MLADLPHAAAGDIADIEPERLEFADRLGRQMVRLVRSITRAGAHFAAHEKAAVESAAYALLAQLILDGPRRTTALAEAMHSDPSTVSRQTATLVRLGLIERRPDPMDGRACLLAATTKGEEVFAEQRKRKREHLAVMLANWPAADLQRFTALLDRFNDDFETYRTQLFGLGRQSAHRDEGEIAR